MIYVDNPDKTGKLITIVVALLGVLILFTFLNLIFLFLAGNYLYSFGNISRLLVLGCLAYYSYKRNMAILGVVSILSFLYLITNPQYIFLGGGGAIIGPIMLVIYILLVILPILIVKNTVPRNLRDAEKKPSDTKSLLKWSCILGVAGSFIHLIVFMFLVFSNNAFFANQLILAVCVIFPIIAVFGLYAIKKNSYLLMLAVCFFLIGFFFLAVKTMDDMSTILGTSSNVWSMYYMFIAALTLFPQIFAVSIGSFKIISPTAFE